MVSIQKRKKVNELTKFLLKLSLGIIFMLSVFLMSHPFEPFGCNHNRRFMKKDISGVITMKEKDSFYSGSERITTKKRLLAWEERGFEAMGRTIYDKVSIGDSVVKKDGELILSVFKKDSIIEIDLSFPCKN